MNNVIKDINLFLFDVDGTILTSNNLLAYAKEILELLSKQGKNFVILTNNSSYSISENRKRINNIVGLSLNPNNIYTSNEASIAYLKKHEIINCYIIGTPAMIKDFEESGITNTADNPQAIILGFDTTLNYEKIKTAALLLQKNKEILYFATNPDSTCPTQEGKIPDVGSFIQLFKEATGREPELIFGKPSEFMINSCLEKYSVDPSNVLVVGDRLNTDMQMGKKAKTRTALVLTGETTRKEAIQSNLDIDFIWEDLGELYQLLLEDETS
ncbi:MAG: HAD-IIA family hydrolase [Candidatus Heimdallarchaeaceae archaeon]